MKRDWTYRKVKEVCDKASSNIVLNKIEDNDGDYALYGASGFVKSVDFYHQEEPYIGIVKDGSGVGRVDAYPAKSSLVGTMQYILPKKDCSLKFLCYALQGLKLSKFVTGAAIPHIYFRDYGECVIPVPPLPTQSSIVSELDLLQSLVDKQQAQLKELDTLAQAVFYDMFGDPVENEKKWPIASIKDVCDSIVRGPFGSALKKDFFVEPNDSTYKVYEQKHAIQKDATIGSYYIDNERFQSLKRFELKAGDIIMSCSGTIGELFEIPVDAEKGIMNQALLKFTLNRSIDKRYFLFAMDFIKESFETKGTGLKNIGSVGTIKNTKVSLPPLSLQQSFANKIEAIEKQKAAINQSLTETQKLFDYTMDKYFG